MAQIYRAESDVEDDSEYEFPDIPNKPSSDLFLPGNPASKASKTENQRPPSSPKIPPSCASSEATQDPPQAPVPAQDSNPGEPQASSLQNQSDLQETHCHNKGNGSAPSSPSLRKKEPPPLQPNQRTLGSSKQQTPSTPLSLSGKRQVSTPTRYTNDSMVTTISNLYTNPAQRSATLGRKKTLSSSTSDATKQDNSQPRLTGDLYAPKSAEKISATLGRKGTSSSSASKTTEQDYSHHKLNGGPFGPKNAEKTSATLGRKKASSSSTSEATEQDASQHRLTKNILSTNAKTETQGPADKRSESVTCLATVRSMKGVETWC